MGVLRTALCRPETYVGCAREAVSALRCVARYPLGLAEATLRTGPSRGDETHDTPVLLVHGYGHNRSGWFPLERALHEAGFSSVHTMNYVAWGKEGVPELAARLAERVQQIRRATGAPKVHVIGHSMGGVLLRWYTQELGGARYVDTAVTIASPHEGTVAALVGVGPGARDLRPGSRVMRRLAAGASRAAGVRWIAFYSNIDVLVQPAPSAMLRHPAFRATNILVKDQGHLAILLAPAVATSVVAQLEAAETGAGRLLPLLPAAPVTSPPAAGPADGVVVADVAF
ncbi:MAG TPA: alpha/beta fold hydrolase [Acidimicrobiales bacterium]|nr:alpha/beta fold hydrolase [Acidimicrobiales bacterium]